MNNRQAIGWSAFWVASAGLFAILLGKAFSAATAMEFLSCYTVEKLLSFDNLLMFYVVFKYFNSSLEQQRKALNIGIISAFILRGAMIFSGGFLLREFSWLSYAFGGFLIYSAYMLFIGSDEEPSPPTKLIDFVRNRLPWLSFFAVVVMTIELIDVLFALDSIPASFGVSGSPIVIFSANLFAIFGLRSMYFIMQGLIKRFIYLETGVSAILALVGIKMCIQPWLSIDITWLFAAIGLILFATIATSLRKE